VKVKFSKIGDERTKIKEETEVELSTALVSKINQEQIRTTEVT
jgi:hypothetical protein